MMKQQMSVQVSSEELSWITPPEIIEKVTKVLGFIDLDPASSVIANKFVKASRIITEQDDIFKSDLSCETLYMNPPFGKIGNKSQAGVFTEYILEQYVVGKIKRGGIILLMSRFGYQWFEDIMDKTLSATLKTRVKFINPHTLKQAAQAKTSQTLFCFGDLSIQNAFISEFNDSARIYCPRELKLDKSTDLLSNS